MSAKHTPGPWVVEENHNQNLVGVMVWAGGEIVAHVPQDQHGEANANAALVASAPDLLYALAGFDRMSDKILSEKTVDVEKLIVALEFLAPCVKAALKKALR
jgi:hypothetical protein